MDELLIEGIVHPVGWSGDRLGIGEGAPWPVPLKRLATAMVALRRVLLDRVSGKPGDRAGNALRLAAYHFSVTAAAVAEATLAIDAERETGLVLTGVAEIEWLRGQTDQIPASVDRRPREKPPSRLRNRIGRVARAVAWSSPGKWPRALLFPDAMAVTHNDLLRGEAAHCSQAIGFRHADEWLSAALANRSGSHETGSSLLELADSVAGDVAKAIRVNPVLEARAAHLLAAQLYCLLETAWRDAQALENARLPGVLWSGTGGNWPARALGIEVIRRGGTVRRFDHGCGFATVLDPQGAGLIELCVSTEFVAATPALADMVREQVGPECPARIEGGRGDPHFRRSPGPVRTPKKRPRVMYVTGATYGFRRLWPVKVSDFGYLDWQLRVARALQTLDIELTLKPHPEGLFRSRLHPLSRLGGVETRMFEEACDDADVVVFDEPTSTTFWVAVASNCRMVLMNASLAEFDPHLVPLIQGRVATVPVRWDASNRPQFELGALEAAIRDQRPVDHRPLRHLMAGDDATARHRV
jgi:hypothetical protein